MKLALLQSVCLRQLAHTQLKPWVIFSNKSSENRILCVWLILMTSEIT